jgi:hypothetical protein
LVPNNGEPACPHIRRAHWHNYWTGPRSDRHARTIELHWLSPMLVGAGQVVPTVRTISEKP